MGHNWEVSIDIKAFLRQDSTELPCAYSMAAH